MALQSVEDIIRALQEHPEWREPLLNALLTDQYRQLPERTDRLEQAMARLAEESAKTDQRLRELSEKADKRFAEMEARIAESNARVDQRFAEMAARMEESRRQTDQRFAEMAARMEESRRETDQRFAEMAAQIEESRRETDQRLRELSEKTDKRFEEMVREIRELADTVRDFLRRVDRWETDLGSVKGITLEMFYRDNATSILGRRFRNVALVDKGQYLQQVLEQYEISETEWQQLVSTDVLVRGTYRESGKEYLTVWEVSWIVDSNDVQRAVRRAQTVGRWEQNALPVVAGKGITAGAQEAVEAHGVLVVIDTNLMTQSLPVL
jgi:chromosome segregation ATPase